jgi:hypothetical protein
MARQAGKIKIGRRKIGRLQFYKMKGEYYVRTKSSLTSQRVKKERNFKITMAYADLLGRASKIGSSVYKLLPVEFKESWMFKAFTGEAMKMLKGGMMDDEVAKRLINIYIIKKKGKKLMMQLPKASRKRA